MISHKYKCIFIHISKCAGSSIENAFGIDISDNSQRNHKNLFGWDENLKLHLQHATPQELLENNLVTSQQWNTYYKFIIVRNPWDRAFSDYSWLCREQKVTASFGNFMQAKGKFFKVLNVKDMNYRGDHLKSQTEYFHYKNQLVNYDKVLYFENLEEDLNEVIKALELSQTFFDKKINKRKAKKINHYSYFYNFYRKGLVKKIYYQDISFFNYSFENKKTKAIDYIKSYYSSSYFI